VLSEYGRTFCVPVAYKIALNSTTVTKQTNIPAAASLHSAADEDLSLGMLDPSVSVYDVLWIVLAVTPEQRVR